MDNSNSKNYPSEVEIVGGVIEVTGSPDGGRLISGLWRIFTTRYQVQKGDLLMDRSRGLLQRHLKRINSRDKIVIQANYKTLRGLREGIEKKKGSSSHFLRNLEARKYRRRALMMYEIVQTASARALDNHLLNQIEEAVRPPATEGGSGTSHFTDTASVMSDPFSDLHAESRITDINVNDLERVEISSIQDEATNEEAALFGLISRDHSVRRIIAFPDDGTDGAPLSIASVPVSMDQEDGPSPRSIAVSIPDVSDERAGEQAETSTLDSFALSELAAPEDNRPHPHPVPLASVRPTEDPYTRTFVPRRPL